MGLLSESLWIQGDWRGSLDALRQATAISTIPTLSHGLIRYQVGASEADGDLLRRVLDCDTDPDRRAYARLALARAIGSSNRHDARSMCADAARLLAATQLPQYDLPIRVLIECLGDNLDAALAYAARAESHCSASAYGETCVDIGVNSLECVTHPNREHARAFLSLTGKIQHAGVGYRIDYQRGLALRTLGESDAAQASFESAIARVHEITLALDTDDAQLFQRSSVIRRIAGEVPVACH